MGLLDLLGLRKRKSRLNAKSPALAEVGEKARSLRELGRIDEAIELLLGVVESDPSVISILGNTYIEAGKPGEAREWFMHGLKLSENADPATNMAARVLATDSLANLGELEWTQGHHERSLELLEKAAGLWDKASNEREKAQKALVIASVGLSLAKKCFARNRFFSALKWSKMRLECAPACSEAKSLGTLSFKFLPRGDASSSKEKNISVLLELRKKVSSSGFQSTVFPYVGQLVTKIAERFGTDMEAITITVAEGPQQLVISGKAKNVRRVGEISMFILDAWHRVTNGKGC